MDMHVCLMIVSYTRTSVYAYSSYIRNRSGAIRDFAFASPLFKTDGPLLPPLVVNRLMSVVGPSVRLLTTPRQPCFC